MTEFSIQIAGKTARVQALFESTRYYCASYLTEAPAEFTITVSQEELEGEQLALREEALREGLRPRTFPDPFLERSVIQKKLAYLLLSWDILLFHGSAVAVDGQGYLFTARCGTGKSTHTRLWRQVFGDRAVMVNDDKPFLKFAGKNILVCGSPWSGKHGLDSNIAVPLKGICILERGKENRIWPISPEEALPMLEKQCGLEGSAHLAQRLAESTLLWKMECNKDPQAAITAWEAMSVV